MRAGPERSLQQALARFSQVALPPPIWWGAIPGGDGRRTLTPGYQRGTPDWLVIHEGRALFFELKSAKGRVSVHQGDCGWRLNQAGAKVFIIRSMEGYEEALRLSGVPLRARSMGIAILPLVGKVA